jgi:hypothetical protein
VFGGTQTFHTSNMPRCYKQTGEVVHGALSKYRITCLISVTVIVALEKLRVVKFAIVETAILLFTRFNNSLPMQGLEGVPLKRRGEAKRRSRWPPSRGNLERT